MAGIIKIVKCADKLSILHNGASCCVFWNVGLVLIFVLMNDVPLN